MSIRKRPSKKAKNGYTWQVYFDKYHYYKSGFKTKVEAEQHEREKLIEFENYGYMSKSVNYTIDQVFEDFMINCKLYQMNTMTKTRVYYKPFSNKYGYVNIKNVKKPLLQAFFDSRSKEGMASNTEIKKALNRIFLFAVDRSYISINPMNGVKVTGITRRMEHDNILSFDDFKTITDDLMAIGTFTSLCYRMAVIVGYYSGLRVSEILALQRKNIDLKNKVIHVRGKLVYDNLPRDKWFISEQLKSETSRNDVPIVKPLEVELRKWLNINQNELVFCDYKQRFVNPTSLSNLVKKVAKKHDIHFHMHMLRHTFTTNLVNNGVEPKTAQELLRHANISTTLNTYTHITEEQKREAINKVFDK